MAKNITIPKDLLGSAEHFNSLMDASSFSVNVVDDYEAALDEANSMPEVIAIQRIITLARNGVLERVIWGSRIASQVLPAPPLFPLLAVLLCLDCQSHFVSEKDGSIKKIDLQSSRKSIYSFRPLSDLFSDSQVIVCADSRGYGRPKSLYNVDGSLISRTDFDAFVERLLSAQVGINVGSTQAVKFSQNVSTIVAELFENTELHGKQDLNGVPFKRNGLRGMLFKRIELPSPVLSKFAIGQAGTQTLDLATQRRIPPVALEISVFDSGIGYFCSYAKQPLTIQTPLLEEWKVVHKCLERHYETAASDATVSDIRASHTGMGLYEVLRALQFLKGKFEVRSGRTYGFRTFLDGETQFQIESSSSLSRPGMPKPVLLDRELKFVRFPTANESLAGSTIRVLIPLS